MSPYQFVYLKQKAKESFVSSLIVTFGLLTIMGTGCGSGNGNGNGSGNDPGTLQFIITSYDATEGTDGIVNIIVNRSGGNDGFVSVDYATADGNAVAGSDYTAANGTLTWPDGLSGNLTISVAITDENTVELSESFTLTLSNVSRATLGLDSSATLNIIDND
jgi:hypothetical protein